MSSVGDPDHVAEVIPIRPVDTLTASLYDAAELDFDLVVLWHHTAPVGARGSPGEIRAIHTAPENGDGFGVAECRQLEADLLLVNPDSDLRVRIYRLGADTLEPFAIDDLGPETEIPF